MHCAAVLQIVVRQSATAHETLAPMSQHTQILSTILVLAPPVLQTGTTCNESFKFFDCHVSCHTQTTSVAAANIDLERGATVIFVFHKECAIVSKKKIKIGFQDIMMLFLDSHVKNNLYG